MFLDSLKRSVEDPARPLTDASLAEVFGAGAQTDSGESVTPASAYRMTAVYRSIALLAGLVGAMPQHAYRRAGGGRVRVDVPAISDPHPDKTAYEVWEWAGQSLLGWGNAYLRKVRDGQSRVRWLHPIDPWLVRVDRKAAWATTDNPTGKRFYILDGVTEVPHSPWEVLHIPGLSYDGLVGMSPIAVARQSIGLGLAAQRYGARMFDRGALIQGVLQSDKPISPDGAEHVREQWRRKAAGGDNHWEIPVLHSGLNFVPVALPPSDAQFIETQRFGVTEVARLFGLPPHLVGDVERSTSWGTGIEHQNMQMLVFTADPWLVRIEQRLSREVACFSDPRVYVKFNRAALLRADTATRYMAYQRAINNGWMSPDEVRALEDLDPIPSGAGGQFFRPANLLPLDAVTQDEEEPPDDEPRTR